MTDLITSNNPVARKEHECDECARTITVGETYRRVTGRHDHQWAYFAQCSHCTAVFTLYATRYAVPGEELPIRGRLAHTISTDYPFDQEMATAITLKWRDLDGNLLPVPTTFEADTHTQAFANNLHAGLTAAI